MKDELNRMILSHFIGLLLKHCRYKRDGGEHGRKRAKGTKRNVCKEIHFDNYLRCLKNLSEKPLDK